MGLVENRHCRFQGECSLERKEIYFSIDLTLGQEHSLCPGEQGREFRRSGPGPILIVGGFSRLGGITHSYLIDCTTRENNLAFVGHVPQAPATEAAFMFNKVGALFGRQRRRVRNGTSDFTSIVIAAAEVVSLGRDRKSTRLNSSHVRISYAVFCLK